MAQKVQKFGMVLPIVLLSYFMILLDNSIIFTSTVHISQDLQMSATLLSWVSNAYALTFGGFLLFFGRMGDIYGRKCIFQIGLVIFTVASFLVGISTSSTMIIVMRAFQGIGSAILAPTTLAFLMDAYRGQQRATAIAYYGVTAGLGASFGLLIGGLITSYSSWRYGFLINVPVGIIMFCLTQRFISQSLRDKDLVLDWWGAILSVITFSSLVYSINGNVLRWLSGVICVFAFVTFLWIESHHSKPLMPLSLFRNGMRSSAYIARFFFMSASMSYFFLMPQALQRYFWYSPLQAAFAFIPMTLTQFIFSLFVNRLTQRFSNVFVLVLGTVMNLTGYIIGVGLGLHHGYFLGVAIPMVFIGVGQGLVLGPMTVEGVSDTKADEAGAASGVVNTVHQIGGAVGLSLVSLLTSSLSNPEKMIVHSQQIMLIYVIIMLLASLNIYRLKSK